MKKCEQRALPPRAKTPKTINEHALLLDTREISLQKHDIPVSFPMLNPVFDAPWTVCDV